MVGPSSKLTDVFIRKGVWIHRGTPGAHTHRWMAFGHVKMREKVALKAKEGGLVSEPSLLTV